MVILILLWGVNRVGEIRFIFGEFRLDFRNLYCSLKS